MSHIPPCYVLKPIVTVSEGEPLEGDQVVRVEPSKIGLVPLKERPQRASKSLSSHAAAESLQSCPTLRDPIDGSPPGSAVPGILQARAMEWVAISFST